MVASWIIGRGRVSAGTRPSWFAAWGLVALDFAALLAVFALILAPLMAALDRNEIGAVATMLIMFVVFFVPLQIVLIASAVWASRSRWDEKPVKEETL